MADGERVEVYANGYDTAVGAFNNFLESYVHDSGALFVKEENGEQSIFAPGYWEYAWVTKIEDKEEK